MTTSSIKKSPGLATQAGQGRKGQRDRSDSDHPLFPAFNGQRWQDHGGLDSKQRVQRQFLEAYFQINLDYARLVALRKRHGPKVPNARQRRILMGIERALVAREKLEDLFASRGVFATPVYRDGFTIDLRFTDGQSGRTKGSPTIVSSASVHIIFPLPQGFTQNRAKTNSQKLAVPR
jgi:hypothetical protein